MIQRKQTLFLLFSGILMLLMVFLSIAKVTTSDMVYSMNATGFEDLAGEVIMPTWGLFGLTILIVLLSFVAIFLYTKRVLQMRITIFNLLLKLGFFALVFVYRFSFTETIIDSNMDRSFSVTLWLALPIVAMIFDYLAYRGIAVDERTIRFMDRLR